MERPTLDGIEVELATASRPRPKDSELGFGRVFTDHMLIWDYEAPGGWQKPKIVPYQPIALDPSAMVLHYGQAIFEGLKGFRGQDGQVRLFRALDHCKRLNAGTPRLCMPQVDAEKLKAAILALVSVDEGWVPSSPGTALYIRPAMIATEPGLGVRASQRYRLFVILSPVGAYYADGFKPLKIWVEEKYVRAAPGGIGSVKAAANYVASLLAAEEAKARGYAQVLWLDGLGRRTFEEVGTMNLFVQVGDEVITAPLEGTILGGMTRDTVITLLKKWGVKVSERRISLPEVVQAQKDGQLREVFGTGTAAVISPVGELGFGNEKLVVGGGQIGELSKRLYEAVTRIQYGQDADTYGWLTPVPKAPPELRRAG
jgi:branched-chain amino acid aminotransferase